MNLSAHAAAGGLYSFKSWYAVRLAPVRRGLVAANVPPAAITIAGIVFGGGAGAALAAAAARARRGRGGGRAAGRRLACANLDGGVATGRRPATAFGSVLNEVGDRAAELAALAGCLAFAPSALVLAAALAATLPSWVALAGRRRAWAAFQGGPVGKTERCLLLALLAAVGFPGVILAVLAGGRVGPDRPRPPPPAGPGRRSRGRAAR